MARPASHRIQTHDKSCENCAFSHTIPYKGDLLCLHGEKFRVSGHVHYPVTSSIVIIDNARVDEMGDDEYDKLWGRSAVEPDDVCDEWDGGG